MFLLESCSHFSCKWTHVWEPCWPGDVRRGQSLVVHLWAWHRGRHPWCLLRGEHLQEAEHNAWHSQPVPSHHSYCPHAAKHSWLVTIHSHNQVTLGVRFPVAFWLLPTHNDRKHHSTNRKAILYNCVGVVLWMLILNSSRKPLTPGLTGICVRH